MYGINLVFQGKFVAHFWGPASAAGYSIVDLALTRPIEFDQLVCDGSPGGWCNVGWVGAEP